ncbi:MAG: hypothetical protein ACYCUM_13770 [Solirubrobacteraceae bacterium]
MVPLAAAPALTAGIDYDYFVAKHGGVAATVILEQVGSQFTDAVSVQCSAGGLSVPNGPVSRSGKFSFSGRTHYFGGKSKIAA